VSWIDLTFYRAETSSIDSHLPKKQKNKQKYSRPSVDYITQEKALNEGGWI
jgi:hypothetical protein